ncbi:cytidine deaminase [Shewanella frigidimarina]|uniref:Cytidine deaminase n=1 Tax=Shewanella frigidimarina TaxID=56812 RepID=A0A119D098_SHEFR|nr:cytidine deaminase [Shewanella frigidimarina]KVX02605.1 cytidine deaminase [Shewanella frigidimarina]
MQNRFLDSITQLDKPLATALVPLLDEQFCGHITAEQFQSLVKASGQTEQQVVMALLPIAASLAIAPISEFYVGAIVKGASGDLYMGANLELPGEALFHSVHAEQSAISHAWLSGETEILDIIINYSPCGHCRQFMNELFNGSKIKIHLPQQEIQTLAHYLPYGFSPADLGITVPLLCKREQEFCCDSDDPMIIEAIDQMGLSYAPYTNCNAAVVLETNDGATFCGRYAENAAFNPSMQPMQMALSNLIRNNRQYSEIKRAVLAESSVGKISLVGAAMDALHAIAPIELQHVVVEPLLG